VRFSQGCLRGFRSSEMWHCATGLEVTAILKDHRAFIFKYHVKTLKMKTLWSFNTLGTSNPMAQCHIPKGLNPLKQTLFSKRFSIKDSR